MTGTSSSGKLLIENSKNSNPLVLIVDDRYRTLRSLTRLISSEHFETLWVPDEQQGIDLLIEQPNRNWIVIIDLNSSTMGGGGFLHRVRRIAPGAAVLVAGPLGPFLYQGGSFYEFCGPTLRDDINKVLYEITRRLGSKRGAEKDRFSQVKRSRSCFDSIIGQSRAIAGVIELIEGLSESSATVLITGESGTGKELIARAVHKTSPHKNRPFVAINCGAIPAPLIESELFGHERGAFTGAFSQKKGKFELAEGGTLFLDEIGDLDRDLQVKLLRVLQEKEFQRVGGNVTVRTNVRVIAATSQNLKKKILTGEFRDDLYYRLNVVPIHIPPLRERREDIALLLDHFFVKAADALNRPCASFTRDARDALIRYGYPGNVRELANICERLQLIARGDHIMLDDLPEEVLDAVHPVSQPGERLRSLPLEGFSLKEVERELILKTLHKTDGNKAAAAKMLGITRRLLYLRLGEYGLG